MTCLHQYILFEPPGTRPVPTELAGVCRHCGEFLVSLTAGRVTVTRTFRLTREQLEAAGKGVRTKGERRCPST
jgi:hypothetical protein